MQPAARHHDYSSNKKPPIEGGLLILVVSDKGTRYIRTSLHHRLMVKSKILRQDLPQTEFFICIHLATTDGRFSPLMVYGRVVLYLLMTSTASCTLPWDTINRESSNNNTSRCTRKEDNTPTLTAHTCTHIACCRVLHTKDSL